MIIAKVVGNVVATVKHRDYEGKKVLIVQPVTPDGKATGKTFLAVDGVQAGMGDMVLVLDEGGSAKSVLQDKELTTIRCVVAGIIDQVSMQE